MKKMFAGLLLGVASFTAAAGFIDERTIPVSPAAGVPGGAPAAVAAQVAPAVVQFEVVSTDKTVREVLARWSKLVGWMHEGDHWTLDRDHAISGVAGPEVFGADFKGAVRTLVSSTELTDQPAQPCFYSNRVVRVIARSASCDRTAN